MSIQNSHQISDVKIMLIKGDGGVSIATIEKTGTSGLVDTYTITLTDGTKTTFTVTNGKAIATIEKTGTSGLVDTYTITFNDGSTDTFTVTNGNGITSIEKTGSQGHVDTYTITFDNGDTETFEVTNGSNDASDISYDSNSSVADMIDEFVDVTRRSRKDITTDLANLSTAVSEQNLEKYGYSIGDFFTGASGYTYILADMNPFKGTATPYCLTTNHIGIVVDTHAQTKWETSGDASTKGYNGSTLHSYLTSTVLNNIKSDFTALFGSWNTHLLAHSKLLTTALANWAWQTDQYISALSEVQVIGSRIWGANGYQTGEASKKLALFDKFKWTEIMGNEYFWLRDMESASVASGAGHDGVAGINSVATDSWAVGLINFY